MKWALIGVLTLAALGAWGMGLQAAGALAGDVKSLPLPKVVMRALPALKGGAIAVAMRDAPKPEAVKAPEPAPPPRELKPEAAPPPAPKEPKPEPVKPTPKEPKEPREPKPAPEPAAK